MKIVFYCQHVLGIGHFFRALELCRALSGHEVIFVMGGEPAPIPLPDHVRPVLLPSLMMDEEFRSFHTAGPDEAVEEVRRKRQKILYSVIEKEAPDVFLVELYPFGRKAFRFEIDPVLNAIRDGSLPPAKIVCSLRDILVEKQQPEAYETRVVGTLNRYFDAVLIHSDPRLVRLEETFSRTGDITAPLVYTGFVTPHPADGERERIRNLLAVGDTPLIVASAGGGKVGGALLLTMAEAFRELPGSVCAQVFSGPFLDEDLYQKLMAFRSPRFWVDRFAPDFLSYLAAADLSVSMAGYNTCMNLMAAKTPALVWPFAQNREQRLRAERLAAFGGFGILEDEDLTPTRLARRMETALACRTRPEPVLDLSGALFSARWLRAAVDAGPPQKEK